MYQCGLVGTLAAFVVSSTWLSVRRTTATGHTSGACKRRPVSASWSCGPPGARRVARLEVGHPGNLRPILCLRRDCVKCVSCGDSDHETLIASLSLFVSVVSRVGGRGRPRGHRDPVAVGGDYERRPMTQAPSRVCTALPRCPPGTPSEATPPDTTTTARARAKAADQPTTFASCLISCGARRQRRRRAKQTGAHLYSNLEELHAPPRVCLACDELARDNTRPELTTDVAAVELVQVDCEIDPQLDLRSRSRPPTTRLLLVVPVDDPRAPHCVMKCRPARRQSASDADWNLQVAREKGDDVREEVEVSVHASLVACTSTNQRRAPPLEAGRVAARPPARLPPPPAGGAQRSHANGPVRSRWRPTAAPAPGQIGQVGARGRASLGSHSGCVLGGGAPV
jgi:hypothetical protein